MRIAEDGWHAAFEPVRRYLGDAAIRDGVRSRSRARRASTNTCPRPEWIRAWNRGQRVLDDEDGLQPVVARMTTSTKEPDRVRLMHDVLARLGTMQHASGIAAQHRGVRASFLPPLLLDSSGRRMCRAFYHRTRASTIGAISSPNASSCVAARCGCSTGGAASMTTTKSDIRCSLRGARSAANT